MKNKLYYGAAYYPELWDEKSIEQDIAIMKKTGINVVRMGEFAWAFMEKEEDSIDVSYFVEMITRLYENGIETVMCTPTPTPPIWMSFGHPQRMYVDSDGKVMSHGARQHICTNNRYFRERAGIITEAVAKALGQLPGLIAWQLDNELKCHVAECMCETCKSLWQEWLKKRYGTVDSLNRSWGTLIWSEYYRSFAEVPQPVKTPFLHNSSLSTLYRLFTRETTAEFAEEQAAVIRKYSKAPITHNSSLNFRVDNELLFENLDFAGFDHYPDCDNYHLMLLNYDLWRNTKKGKGFWVMETAASHNGNLESYRKTHRNGYLSAEAVAAYALGAQGFMYWLWRQQRTGCEQAHGSIVSSWGKPAIGYDQVVNAEKMKDEVEDIILATAPAQAQVAITYSDRARAYFLTEPLENILYYFMGEFTGDSDAHVAMGSWYKTILDTGIHRDLIFEGADLKGYRIVMTPFLPYISDQYMDRAVKFVEDGGVWIVGPMSGGRTGEHTVHTDAALGRLEALAGVETLYSYPISKTGAVGNAFGVSAPLGLWACVFEPKDAGVMGWVEGGVTPGTAFITESRLGKGKIVMLGAMPVTEQGRTMLQKMLLHYADEKGVDMRMKVSAGTVVAPRIGEDGTKFWFIVNMDGAGGVVELPDAGYDAVHNKEVAPGMIRLGSYEYRVIRFR